MGEDNTLNPFSKKGIIVEADPDFSIRPPPSHPYDSGSAATPQLVSYDPVDTKPSYSYEKVALDPLVDTRTPAPSSAPKSAIVASDVALNTAFAERERALAQKERELAEKERFLKENEAHLTRKPNWPWCYPMLYHSIDRDIEDVELHHYVRRGYFLWYWWTWICLWNLVCASGYWIIGSSDGATCFGIAFGYFLVGIPLGFFLWYRPLYHGCRKQKAGPIRMFHVFFISQFIFNLFACLGWSGSGALGLIAMIDLLNRSYTTLALLVVVNLVGVLGWCIYAPFLWWRVYSREKAFGFRGRKGAGERFVEVII
jgi:hypothetical protein